MGRPPSDIRERLLDAALSAFAEAGVEGASLRKIAAAAGTSVGMISYHFGNKEGLFDAVVQANYAPVMAKLTEADPGEGDVVDRLMTMLIAFGDAVAETPKLGAVMFHEAAGRTPRLLRQLPLFVEGHMAVILRLLVEAQAAGRIRPLPLQALLAVILSPFVLPAVLGVEGMMGMSPGDVSKTAVAVLKDGLLLEA